MQVKMGNATPHASIVDHSDPCVHVWNLPDGIYTHEIEGRPNGKAAFIHVLSNDVTHLPGHECFVSIVSDWPKHSPKPPTWVAAIPDTDENAAWADDLARMLSEAYDCPVGIPDDVEDTHHTESGPPGVGPKTEG